jgi:poly(hydroxyalkanoate) granule-associated protein
VNLPWLREQGAEIVAQIRTRLDKEGRKAYRQLEGRVADLQKRLGRDTANLGRRVDDTVRGTLARLNIPNRREIAELTRKVDELSRKIDAFQTRSRRKSARA